MVSVARTNQLSLKTKYLVIFQIIKIKISFKFSLTGDKFMPELHFKRPGFTYIACRLFTKHCAKIQKFRETGNLKHLFRN